jgi:serine/threonine protein kinase
METLRKKWSEFMDSPSSDIREMIKTKPGWLRHDLSAMHQSLSGSIHSFTAKPKDCDFLCFKLANALPGEEKSTNKRKFAVKIIKQSDMSKFITQEKLIDRFVGLIISTNAQTRSSQSFFLNRIYDIRVYNRSYYIVSDWIGTNLETKLKLYRPQSSLHLETSLFGVVYFAAVAIDFLHNKGILCLNLKPSNVMIDRSDIPKLGDFGYSNHSLGTLQAYPPMEADFLAPEVHELGR